MVRFKQIVFIVAANLLMFPLCAVAQESPFSAAVIESADFNPAIAASLHETSAVTVINPVDPITITTQLHTLGNIAIHLNREWHVPQAGYLDNGFALKELKSNGMHLQGYVVVRAASASGKRKKKHVPVAATIFHMTSSKPTFVAAFYADTKGNGGHFYEVKGALNKSQLSELLHVRRVSRQAFGGKSCGLNAGGQTALEPALRGAKLAKPAKATSLQSFDLATEADYEWFARYGSSSNTQIQSILNRVQTIYEEQLNLTFSVTKQVVVSTSGARYTSSNVDTLLSSFRTYSEANGQLGDADLYHLYTGKDTYLQEGSTQNSAVIGLAYLGVVCAFPSYSYGLTEDLDDALNHITSAHEMGHNFGAEHDAAGSIMGTTLNLNNPPTQFSTTSKNQIAAHVSANSDCLSTGGASPTPTRTPGGGSGNDPGEGDTSHVALTATVNSKGQVNLSTTFTEVDASCSAELRASSKSGRVYNGSGTLIASLDSSYATTTFSKVPVKRRGASRIYFGVTKTCGDTVYYSATKSLNPKNVKSDKPTLTAGDWIKALKSKVNAATPAKQ